MNTVLLEGNAQQRHNQSVAVGVTIVCSVVATFVIAKLVQKAGLDLSVHGEVAYQV